MFKDKITQSSATGYANTPRDLWTQQLSGGEVNDGDATRFRFGVDSVSGPLTMTGSAKLTLNGVTLVTIDLSGNTCKAVASVLVVRDGSSGANVVTTVEYGGGVRAAYNTYKSGLSWASQQTMKIVGESTSEGGTVLQWLGRE